MLVGVGVDQNMLEEDGVEEFLEAVGRGLVEVGLSSAKTKVYAVAGCGPAVSAILRRSSALLRGRQYGGPY